MDRYKVDLKYNYYFGEPRNKDYTSNHKTLKSAKEEYNTLKDLINESEFDRSFDMIQLVDRVKGSVVESYTRKDYELTH